MASHFYTRFIPSSRPNSIASETPISDGEMKEHNTDGTNYAEIDKKDSLLNSVSDVSLKSQDREKKHKRNGDEKAKTNFNQESSSEDGGLAARKHKRLRSKFQKSELVSKIVQKHKKNADDVDFKVKPSPSEETKFHGLEPIPQPEIEEEQALPPISTLPEWITKPRVVSASQKVPFSELPLSASTRAALTSKGYHDAFAVQSAVLPMLLPSPQWYRGDVCIASGTGTGKTLAFILPMIESLRNRPARRLRGLIVVPTRELVSQTRALIETCSSGSGLSIASSEGSKTLNEERKLLISVAPRFDPVAAEKRRNTPIDYLTIGDSDDDNFNSAVIEGLRALPDYVADYRSKVDVLVCTPGRLVDHLKSTTGFTLDHVEWFVIDEVDRLLDQSYQEWVEHVIPALERETPVSVAQAGIINNLFRGEKRRVRKIVASATLTTDISKLVALHLYRPVLISLEGKNDNPNCDRPQSLNHSHEFVLPESLEEVGVPVVKAADKPLYLLDILDQFLESSKTVSGSFSQSEFHSEMIPRVGTKSPSNSDSSSISSFTEERSLSSVSTSSDKDNSKDGSSTDGSSPTFDPRKLTYSNAKLSSDTGGLVIFTTTNEKALRLGRLLSLLRPTWSSKIGCLVGSNTSASRRKTLTRLRRGELVVIVTSNLAARGLNIGNLAHVVNYDIPTSLESYVHRVGRTARAGKKGKTTTLLAHHEARWFWNEIARTERVSRRRKVTRGVSLEISEETREKYEQALNRLGEEAQGRL